MTNRQTQLIPGLPSRARISFWTAAGLAALGVAIWLIYRADTVHEMAGAVAAILLAREWVNRSVDLMIKRGRLLLLLVLASLAAWYRGMGSISVATVHEPRAELYYWITITLSQTLGTALGDWVADGPLGYLGAAAVFGSMLAVLAVLYGWSRVSHVALFWAAFILTRPLGATVGDFLDKPVAKGGLEFSRPIASLVLIVTIVGLIWLIPQRAGAKAKVAAA